MLDGSQTTQQSDNQTTVCKFLSANVVAISKAKKHHTSKEDKPESPLYGEKKTKNVTDEAII